MPFRRLDPGFVRGVRMLRRMWRQQVRPRWITVRPLALVTLGVSVLVLGTIGFEQYKQLVNGKWVEPYGFLDSLYRAITLYGLGGTVNPPVPTTLQIARIIAPVLTGYAAHGVIFALSREQARVLAIRLFVRRHVIIAGLGKTGSRLAMSVAEQEPVVVVELDPLNSHLRTAPAHGVRTLVGNAIDELALRRAGIERARAIVISCGDDGTNIDVAAAAARALARGRHPVTVFVHLADVDLWSTLALEGATFGSPPAGMRLEYFNVLHIAAQLMVERNPPFTPEPDAGTPYRPNVLIVGLEGVGEPLVLQLIRTWLSLPHGPEHQLTITLAGASATEDAVRLRGLYPMIDSYCQLQVRAMPIESAPYQSGAVMLGSDGRCDVTSAYVCLRNETDALIAALALHALPDTSNVPVAVSLTDAGVGVGVALASAEGRFAAITPFGVRGESTSSELLLRGMNELFARAQHAQWLAAQEAKGISAERKPTMKPWDQLDETQREVNRRFADDIQNKLRLVGYKLVPMPLPDPSKPPFRFTDEEVELLAREEHIRWMKDKLDNGWRYGPVRDDARKIHDQIKSWDELDEENRDWDRDAVRQLPSTIELAGFRLEKQITDGDPR